MSHILVTGGAGYIGSHTVLQLLEAGHQVTVLDNLSNASAESLKRVQQLSGKTLAFIQGDIRDSALLNKLFATNSMDAVIHFAGLKAVGESVEQPLRYYQNNVYGTLVLCEAMQAHGVKNLVFSSSATVYGDPVSLPLLESMPTGNPTNPYGQSKLMVELILKDLFNADPSWNIALLRYFNPVGAHASGRIGEDPNGIPNNLMPFVAQVATGRRAQLSVFGDDYPTPDGTGVRDYIHVEDLAAGHLKALDKLQQGAGLKIYNLGTGKGYSVLDMVKAFEQASNKPVPYQISPRRAGDVASCYADASLAEQELGWKATKGIEEMCQDTWRWQSQNPDGYQGQ
ncbi:UDP-glucose 4-epimerase GalE [Bowmanella pacifica]|uniref:UDP-glucose 4-epimerase n=1 Tax=Bowmanella pacifica TaxID=502051 RepID=A0A918DFW2_9ALTE|nr:UDP-glucose 4-epimerase GalE [Bowmanella pacifica]GGO63663.1 UDP-glucose 4-epimerase [Bowmanella pacifica]